MNNLREVKDDLLKEWINNGALAPSETKEIEDIKSYIDILKEHKIFAIAPDDYDDVSLENHLISILPDKNKKM